MSRPADGRGRAGGVQRWRISLWFPLLVAPLGALGLLLVLGAAASDDPWYVAMWSGALGLIAVGAAGFTLLERARAFVEVGPGRLRYRLALGDEREVALGDVRELRLRAPKLHDRRMLLLLETHDGQTFRLPAWAAWQERTTLAERLVAELEAAGAAVDAELKRTLGVAR